MLNLKKGPPRTLRSPFGYSFSHGSNFEFLEFQTLEILCAHARALSDRPEEHQKKLKKGSKGSRDHWTEKFFQHEGEFYTYPAPNFEWEHDMSPPSSEFMNLDTKILEKINIVPQPVQKPHPPLWQVVDSPSSIEWAAKNDISIIMWIPPVQSLKKRFEIYKNAKSEKEKRHVELGEGISVVRDMFVADSMEEAKEKAGEQMVNYMRWVCHWRGLGTHMNPGEELPKTDHKLA